MTTIQMILTIQMGQMSVTCVAAAALRRLTVILIAVQEDSESQG